jgi:Kef-type K+ transport system membrane component KefB
MAPGTFFAIIAASAIAATLATVAGGRGFVVPVVVIELLLGILLGPYVLGLKVDQFIQFFADLGLGLLFSFAGYEIDMQRIMGLPLRLGLIGWLLSLALAYSIGGALAASGIVLSLLYTLRAARTTARPP